MKRESQLVKLQKGRGCEPKKIVFQTANGSWEPVACPPLIARLSTEDLKKIIEEPFVCDIPCHSQSVEHTVALVSQVTKNQRTEDNQVMSILQIASARKQFSGRVTHKRFRADLEETDRVVENSKLPKLKDTPFNRVLFKDL